jgi:DNA-binding IclR family transcriptional regulator
MPLHCTAIGKVLLASFSDTDYDRFVHTKGLSPRTPRTLTDPKELRQHLEQVSIQGYAVDNEEFEAGLICVAAPVLGISANVIAAAGISAPVFRASGENLQQLISLVCDTARAISREMGFNGS